MNDQVIILRYGELSLKSTYVRKYFETRLIQNIKNAFRKEQVPIEIHTQRGRIYLMTPQVSKSLTILPRIFGIVSFSPAIQTTSHLQDISEIANHITKNTLPLGKSFAIRVTRVGTHPYTSQDVAIQIGNDIVQATQAKVNLNNPDFELFIEIRENNAYLFTEKLKGVGGLPLGTQGTILTIINDSSSLLAAWYLMRRGCNSVFVTPHQSNETVIRSFLSEWYTDAEILPLEGTLADIPKRVSEIASEKKCDAIVTDHSIENFSKNILELMELKKHYQIPILTPLISLESNEIEHQCKLRSIPI
jgi:tRNA uracil 4-sulfurtransferase